MKGEFKELLEAALITYNNAKSNYQENHQNGSFAKEKNNLGNIINNVTKIDYKSLVSQNGGDSNNIKKSEYIVITSIALQLISNNNNSGITIKDDQVYFYNRMYWEVIETDVFKTFLGNIAIKMGVPILLAKHYSFIDDLYRQFSSISTLKPTEKENDIVKLNVANGTIYIENGIVSLNPFSKDDFITYQLGFEFNTSEDAPIFKKFLDDVLPDKKSQNVLAEYLGSIFIPNKFNTIKIEKALLLKGVGGNGKSVVFEVISSLLGSNNISNYSLSSLTDDKGYQRAMIQGKLLNYASEISSKLNLAVFKQMTSGEPLEARLPYGKPFLLKDYPKLMFNTNVLPQNIENTSAFFRRLIIIDFDVTIPPEKQDKSLHTKIINSELPGVLNWIIEGLRRLIHQGGFTPSDKIDATLKTYKTESDSVELFINEFNYKPSKNNKVLLKKLYEKYKKYSIDSSYRFVNKTEFKKQLMAKNFTANRFNYGIVIFIESSNSNMN